MHLQKKKTYLLSRTTLTTISTQVEERVCQDVTSEECTAVKERICDEVLEEECNVLEEEVSCNCSFVFCVLYVVIVVFVVTVVTVAFVCVVLCIMCTILEEEVSRTS